MSNKFLALRSLATGELVRLHRTENDFERTYLLSRDPSHPVFEAQNGEQLAKLLLSDTPDYNTSETQPGWGGLEPEDLEAVEVEVETRVSPVELPVLLSLRTQEVRSIHRKLAEQYAKRALELAPGTSTFVFWLAYLPEGHTVETLRAFEGKMLYANNGQVRRHLYAATTVPEEWVPCFGGQPGVLLVASEVC